MTTELVNIAAEKNKRFLCGILSPTAALENPKTSCHDHVYSEQTKCVLTTGDTVCFEGPLGHSREIGRIIELYRSGPTSGDLEQLSFGLFDRSDDYFFQIRMLLPCEGHDAICHFKYTLCVLLCLMFFGKAQQHETLIFVCVRKNLISSIAKFIVIRQHSFNH